MSPLLGCATLKLRTRAYVGMTNPYHGWTVDPQVERVIAERSASGLQFLVKWRGLAYGEATWESAATLDSEADKVHTTLR